MGKVEFNKELFSKIISENPALKVVPLVEVYNSQGYEDDYDDEEESSYTSWSGGIINTQLDEIIVKNNKTYIKSCNLMDLIYDELEALNKNSNVIAIPNDKTYKIYEEKVKNYNWEKAIILRFMVGF